VGGLANNLAALLCYVPCTALIASVIWLVTEPKSNFFLRFHALQSLLFGASTAAIFVALMITFSIVGFILGQVSGALALVVWLLSTVLYLGLILGMLVGLVLCMMKAYQGQLWKLPVVGELAEKYAR
jgi:uncharacterized membrane protein